ncbi:MAG: hypothetical protein GY835_01150 [bacterium]|nr:hypothetical protein [bacterium]
MQTIALEEALAELVSIGMDRTADRLNEMLNMQTALTVTGIHTGVLSQFMAKLRKIQSNSFSCVSLDFNGEIAGQGSLLISRSMRGPLVSAVSGERVVDINFEHVRAGTLSKIGSIMIIGIMETLGRHLSSPLRFTSPLYLENVSGTADLRPDTHKDMSVVILDSEYRIDRGEIGGKFNLIFKFLDFGNLADMAQNMYRYPGE